MRLPSLVVLALLAAGTAAVPSSAAAQDSAKAPKAASTKRDRNVITADELSTPERQAQSVFDVVRSLRPNFLNVRGTQSCLAAQDVGGCSPEDRESGKVHASVDGTTIVAVDEMKNLRASTVTEIRFLNPSQAMQKFGGAAHQGPVILVTTM
jgi:ABC-type phosphate transport system substrate-binding protein